MRGREDEEEGSSWSERKKRDKNKEAVLPLLKFFISIFLTK